MKRPIAESQRLGSIFATAKGVAANRKIWSLPGCGLGLSLSETMPVEDAQVFLYAQSRASLSWFRRQSFRRRSSAGCRAVQRAFAARGMRKRGEGRPLIRQSLRQSGAFSAGGDERFVGKRPSPSVRALKARPCLRWASGRSSRVQKAVVGVGLDGAPARGRSAER